MGNLNDRQPLAVRGWKLLRGNEIMGVKKVENVGTQQASQDSMIAAAKIVAEAMRNVGLITSATALTGDG